MSNKTPYEIRTELLRLAYEICTMKANAETCRTQSESRLEITAYPTSAPTTEEIITEAEKLNAFVSQDKPQSDRSYSRSNAK